MRMIKANRDITVRCMEFLFWECVCVCVCEVFGWRSGVCYLELDNVCVCVCVCVEREKKSEGDGGADVGRWNEEECVCICSGAHTSSCECQSQHGVGWLVGFFERWYTVCERECTSGF